MNVTMKPDIEKFVDQQVKTGQFSSAAEVLEAGVARLMLDPETDELDASEVADIRCALDQMRRGEVVDWRTHSAATRRECPHYG